jgi:hypothetical protein
MLGRKPFQQKTPFFMVTAVKTSNLTFQQSLTADNGA